VSAWEVEEVFWQSPVRLRNKRHRSGDWKMVGRTRAGRSLTVVVTLDARRAVLRPITGWDATAGEVTRYLEA